MCLYGIYLQCITACVCSCMYVCVCVLVCVCVCVGVLVVQMEQAVTLLNSAEEIVGSLELDAPVHINKKNIGECNYHSHYLPTVDDVMSHSV